MAGYLDVYQEAGLKLKKRPLGPFLPAPKLGGSFCARPLTTAEAADWLRALLQGTPRLQVFQEQESLPQSNTTWVVCQSRTGQGDQGCAWTSLQCFEWF